MLKAKMKLGLVITFAMLMCVAVAGSALASDWAKKTHDSGSTAVALSGGLTYNPDAKSTSIQIMTGVEYFLSAGWALGIDVSGSYNMSDDNDDSGSVYFMGKATYYFVMGGNAVPFLGVRGGAYTYAGGGNSSTTWIVGIKAGAEFLFSEDAAVVVAYAPNYFKADGADKGTFVHNIEVGLVFYF